MMAKKILVVDCDENVRTFMAYVLKKAGHAVATAPDKEEGLGLFNATMPDLVILVHMYQDCDAFEFCQTIRKQGLRPDTPVLIGLYKGAARPAPGALSPDWQHYFMVPIGPADLVQLVATTLEAGI